MKTRSLNLSTQLLTLEENNHLDSASQATPGYAAIPSTVMTLAQRGNPRTVWGCLIQLQVEILVSTKSGRQNATKLQPQYNVNLLPRISLVNEDLEGTCAMMIRKIMSEISDPCLVVAKMHAMIETSSLSQDALRTEQASLEVTVWTSEIDDAMDRISFTDAGPPTW